MKHFFNQYLTSMHCSAQMSHCQLQARLSMAWSQTDLQAGRMMEKPFSTQSMFSLATNMIMTIGLTETVFMLIWWYISSVNTQGRAVTSDCSRIAANNTVAGMSIAIPNYLTDFDSVCFTFDSFLATCFFYYWKSKQELTVWSVCV